MKNPNDWDKEPIRRVDYLDEKYNTYPVKDPENPDNPDWKWALDPNWQWNEDNTIKLDENKLKPTCDSSKVQVTFNALTNQYVIGPISLNYVRAATQQGYRAKVDFSGITGMKLYGLDANGNTLKDTNGDSALQLQKMSTHSHIQEKNFILQLIIWTIW